MTLLILFFYSCCFLLGSLNGAFLIYKYRRLKIDPRIQGSRNPGTTNMFRLYGHSIGLSVFVFDFLKSFLPLLFIKQSNLVPVNLSALLLTCVLAHCFSPFLMFKGGKGLATLLGGLWALHPSLSFVAMLHWAAVYALSSISGLSALCMLSFLLGSQLTPTIDCFLISALFLVFIQHRSNWIRWQQHLSE